MRILVVTRSYPAPGDLYQYPFVHRRVLAYRRAGHDVAVFRPGTAGLHEFESISCHSGQAQDLTRLVHDFAADVIAAHGLSEEMWPLLAPFAGKLAIRAWLHGSEIPAFFRAKARSIADSTERSRALGLVQKRCAFWNAFLEDAPARFGFVFVSQAAVAMARQDWGYRLDTVDFAVIPNPIDTELFAYRSKSADDRWNVLTIRPFDSPTYGNDLAVAAISRIASNGEGRVRFTVIGDGPMFDQSVAPILGLPNLRIERRFLTQPEIAREHQRHGIFMVPTRLDTQGVSRDEAMASGLVPVTNAIPAIEEFVDGDCAGLAPPDDVEGLIAALVAMLDDPDLYLRRSAAAADRVRRQSGQEVVIPQELALLHEAAFA